MREYGGYSGLAERLASRTTVEQLAGKNPVTAGRIVKSPFDFMRAVNEVAEQGPKIGDFIHYQKQGMAPRRAAIMAREGTVDYWMGGTTAKALNPVVMFLNANMRALYNAAEPLAVGTRKERIGAALRLSSLAAASALACTSGTSISSIRRAPRKGSRWRPTCRSTTRTWAG
jgi:hypothetical protein